MININSLRNAMRNVRQPNRPGDITTLRLTNRLEELKQADYTLLGTEPTAIKYREILLKAVVYVVDGQKSLEWELDIDT